MTCSASLLKGPQFETHSHNQADDVTEKHLVYCTISQWALYLKRPILSVELLKSVSYYDFFIWTKTTSVILTFGVPHQCHTM